MRCFDIMVLYYEVVVFFFFKQKTAYEIPKRDWSSDVCSSDLPEFLPRIFDRFTIRSKDAKAGTGLGLAIAKEIVQAHGGAIHVSSALHKGTEFTFTIPATPQTVQKPLVDAERKASEAQPLEPSRTDRK